MLQEIQVRGGVKNDPIRWGGGVDFFLKKPIVNVLRPKYNLNILLP